MNVKKFFQNFLFIIAFCIFTGSVNLQAFAEEMEVNVQIIKEDKTYNDGDNVPLSMVVSNAGSNKINNVCINYLLPEELKKANTALKSQDLGSIESHKEAKTDIIIKSDKKQIQ